MKEKELRAMLVALARATPDLGLGPSEACEISARTDDQAMVVTPGVRRREGLRVDALALMPLTGEYGAWRGRLKPSEEWRLHLDVMRARPDVGAIVQCRPTYATALSMLKRPIPAVHYRIAAFGGPTIRCADYAPYGTKELAELALAALEDRNGALLANHGMIATGADLEEAVERAMELESLAEMYCLALSAGRPSVLPDDEVMRVAARLKAPVVATPVVAKGSKKAPRKKTRSRKSATKAKSSRRAKKARKA